MKGTSTASSMFSVDAYRSKFIDAARPYLFYVTPVFPSIASIVHSGQDLAYLVKSSSLPQSQVGHISTDWQGRDFKFGGTQSFSSWTLDFYMDLNATCYDSYLSWLKYINHPQSNQHGDPSQYMVNQPVQMLDGSGTSFVEAYQLVGAFPTAVSAISLDYGSKNQFSTFNVTFEYQYHLSVSSLTSTNGS